MALILRSSSPSFIWSSRALSSWVCFSSLIDSRSFSTSWHSASASSTAVWISCFRRASVALASSFALSISSVPARFSAALAVLEAIRSSSSDTSRRKTSTSAFLAFSSTSSALTRTRTRATSSDGACSVPQFGSGKVSCPSDLRSSSHLAQIFFSSAFFASMAALLATIESRVLTFASSRSFDLDSRSCIAWVWRVRSRPISCSIVSTRSLVCDSICCAAERSCSLDAISARTFEMSSEMDRSLAVFELIALRRSSCLCLASSRRTVAASSLDMV
mmetsp:Transcript_25014/g.59422  ORF Transcript_25014/g.59422 Transcript_25014/m.59422 type:complete len:275 (+) Transcript_25014:1900-2724(+)